MEIHNSNGEVQLVDGVTVRIQQPDGRWSGVMKTTPTPEGYPGYVCELPFEPRSRLRIIVTVPKSHGAFWDSPPIEIPVPD